MRKLVLLMAMMIITMCGFAQTDSTQNNNDLSLNKDIVVLDKKTHESIRKDLEDYKVLLLQYKLLKQEFNFYKKEHDELSHTLNETLTQLNTFEMKYNTLSFKYDKIVNQNILLQNRVNHLEFKSDEFEKILSQERYKRYKAEKFAKHSVEWKISVLSLSVFCIILMANQ